MVIEHKSVTNDITTEAINFFPDDCDHLLHPRAQMYIHKNTSFVPQQYQYLDH